MTGLKISVIIFAVSLGLLAFILTFILVARATSNKRQISKRVDEIVPEELSAMKAAKDKNNENLSESKLKRKLISIKLMDVLSNELVLANIKMKPEEFAVAWLLAAFGPSGLMALFRPESMMPPITLAIFGAVLPVIIVKQRRKKRTLAFEVQLSDALLVTCNCLRSGLSFQQAMETIDKEMSPPINEEFGRAIKEIKYGVTVEKALQNMTDRIKSADLMLTVSAVSIQKQTGGNLSEILQTISETIKERMKIKSDIKTMTAQGRISGLVVGVLPIALGGVLMIMNPTYMSMLFTTSTGRMLLMVSAGMESIGYLLIKKVINIKL